MCLGEGIARPLPVGTTVMSLDGDPENMVAVVSSSIYSPPAEVYVQNHSDLPPEVTPYYNCPRSSF